METGIVYELQTPRGNLVFEPDSHTMGLRMTSISGMGGPPLRTGLDPIPQRDGAIVFPSFDTERQPILECELVELADYTQRRIRMDQVVSYCESMKRQNGVLRFWPTGGEPRRINVRLYGNVEPLDSDALIKRFQIPLVAADPRIYSDVEIVGTVAITSVDNPFRVACTNEGGVETLPTVILTGQMSNCFVYNETYSADYGTLDLDKLALGGGSKVEIDSRQEWLHTPGASDDLARFVNYQNARFFPLRSGINQVTCRVRGSVGGSAAMEVRFRHAYA